METKIMDTQNTDQDPRLGMDNDALTEANRRASPQISVASGFTPGFAAGLCGVALLGIITFSSLAAQRNSAQAVPSVAQGSAPANGMMAPANGQNIIPVRAPEQAPVLVPPANTMAPVNPGYVGPLPTGMAPAKTVDPAILARLQSPVIAVDLSRNNPQAAIAAATNAPKSSAQSLGKTISGEERDTARAGRLGNAAFTVPEGTVLAGTLETAINSDLPGHVRAVVSRNVTSFDGSQILIPKGSRLVGQYQSNLAVGQKRTFIIWERLIRPDGVTIALESPGTDSLGRAGVTGKVNSHFFRRFGAALLLSVIDAGSRAVSASSGNVVIGGGASGAANAVGSGLQNDLNIPPTIKVAQGTAIRIFLNRDLDFTDIGAASGQ
jgi:type IV secretory pathway VirB10-like protein